MTVDDAWRPYRVWRHQVGTPVEQDTMVFEEPDERFHVYVGLTRSERYLMIRSASVLTSEVWLCDAATPEAGFAVVVPRRQGVEYDVEDAGDQLLILHNSRRGELRDRDRAGQRPRGLDPAGARTGPTPGCSAWTRSRTSSSCTSGGTG